MTYHDSFEQSSQYARQALELMAAYKVPTTPCNFTVWYAHISERNPDLSRMISILLDNDQEFTDDVNADLYLKFFGQEGEIDSTILHEAAQSIEDELQRITTYMGEAGDGTAAYGKSLASAQSDFSSAREADGLKAAISKILNDTHKMEQVNQTLENKLASSTQEIGRLQDDLEDMRKEALTDALTGIANRKMFDMELRRHAADAMEKGESLSLLMVDIDHFKKFNDTFGHQTGDEVLKLLGHTLTKSVKGDDVSARYGGEEFAVILPRTTLEGAKHVAEGIRTRISQRKLVNRTTNQDLGRITVSVGAGLFIFGESLSDFIKRTDQALYKAKATGRDRVVGQDDLKHGELSFG